MIIVIDDRHKNDLEFVKQLDANGECLFFDFCRQKSKLKPRYGTIGETKNILNELIHRFDNKKK